MTSRSTTRHGVATPRANTIIGRPATLAHSLRLDPGAACVHVRCGLVLPLARTPRKPHPGVQALRAGRRALQATGDMTLGMAPTPAARPLRVPLPARTPSRARLRD